MIDTLDDCNLSREEFTELLDHFQLPNVPRLSYAAVDPKVKKTFTLKYNKASHSSQLLVEAQLLKGGKKRKVVKKEEDDEGEEEEVNDDDDVSAFAFKPKKTKAKAKPKPKARKKK